MRPQLARLRTLTNSATNSFTASRSSATNRFFILHPSSFILQPFFPPPPSRHPRPVGRTRPVFARRTASVAAGWPIGRGSAARHPSACTSHEPIAHSRCWERFATSRRLWPGRQPSDRVQSPGIGRARTWRRTGPSQPGQPRLASVRRSGVGWTCRPSDPSMARWSTGRGEGGKRLRDAARPRRGVPASVGMVRWRGGLMQDGKFSMPVWACEVRREVGPDASPTA